MSASDCTKLVFEEVRRRCEIPDRIMQSAYGPSSGLTKEEKAVSCYLRGMLTLKPGWEYVDMCIECGQVGHRRRTCPTLCA